MAETWPKWLDNPRHIAEGIDWIRWKSQDRAKIVLAIGANALAVAKPREMDAEDAIAILADLQDQIAQALRLLDEKRQTHLFMALPLR